MLKEKRAVPRISANVNCIVFVDDGKHSYRFNGIVKDISEEGVCIILGYAEKTYDLIQKSQSIVVQFVGPVDDTLAKQSLNITLLSKWYKAEGENLLVGGLY